MNLTSREVFFLEKKKNLLFYISPYVDLSNKYIYIDFKNFLFYCCIITWILNNECT